MKSLLGLSLLLLVSFAAAHVCLLYPMQRGALNNINRNASVDCGQTQSPCGKNPPKSIEEIIESNVPIRFIFQKNQNHYQPGKNGYFNISIARKVANLTFETLVHIPDTNTSSLTLYVNETMLPKITEPLSHAVIQAVYITNIDGAGPFYACADIAVSV